MPILTRLLAPEAYGTAAMVGTMISLLSVIPLAGLDMSYIRAYPSKLPPSGRSVEVYVWHTALGLGLVTCILAVIAWGLIAEKLGLPGYLKWLVGAGIILSLANTLAQTRARLNSRYRTMSVAVLASGFLGTAVAIGVAFWWRRDELPLILVMLTGYLIPVLVLGVPAYAQMIEPSGLNAKEKTSIFKIGLAGIVTAPAFWLITSSDRWFLGYFGNQASVGIYSLGYNIAIMGMMVNNSVMLVWTPETARKFEEDPSHASADLGHVASRLIGGFACVWLAVTAGGGDAIRLLAPPAFHDAAVVIPFLAAGVFFHAISHLWNANLLVMKRLSYAMWWWIAGGVACVLLNLALVPGLGRLGAAFAQTLSYAIVAIGIVIAAQKICPLQIAWQRVALTLVGIVALAIVMYPPWSAVPILSLLLKLPVGLLAVVIVLNFLAPELFPLIYRRLAGIISKV
jgi:O-antigen/teichoic acid export membrane protein